MTILKERLVYEEEILKSDLYYNDNISSNFTNEIDLQYSLLDSHANNLISSIGDLDLQSMDNNFLDYLDSISYNDISLV